MLYAQKVIIDSDHKDGYIQSVDYVPGKSGFIIRWNGDCEFNEGLFRGDIYANNGVFKGSIYGGTINIGPLFVSDDQTTPSQTKTYPANTTIENFVGTYFRPSLHPGETESQTLTLYYGGTITNNSGVNYELAYIVFYVTLLPLGVNHQFRYSIDFRLRNGSSIKIDDYIGNYALGYTVVINGGGSGNTFKLTGLPQSDPRSAGKLYYRIEDSIVRISQG